jgi:cell division septation protein DedD
MLLARQFFIGALLIVLVSAALFFGVFSQLDPQPPQTTVDLTVVDAKTGTIIPEESKISATELSEHFTDTTASTAQSVPASSSTIAASASESKEARAVILNQTPINAFSPQPSTSTRLKTDKQDKTSTSKVKAGGTKSIPAITAAVEADKAKTSDQWWVQVAAFQHQGVAKKIAAKLKTQGFRVQIDSISQPKRILFRVKVGPYPPNKINQAKNVLTRLKQTFPDARLVKVG